MAPSCYNAWKGPLCFAISVVLAFIAISLALHSHAHNANPIKHQLALNASRALRKSGFNIFATLLQISPEILFSSRNSTIFAIKDSAINSSLPAWLLKNLLKYHTSPLTLSMEDLLKMPQGSCFSTLLHSKNVAVTKVYAKKQSVEINHVLVSHPDLLLEGPISIHGVLGPFLPLDPQNINQGWDHIQSPKCNSNSILVSDIGQSKNMVEWTRIIQLLSSNGLVSFAIGLHSALDGILEGHMNLSSVTIFAAPGFAFVASSSPLLDKIVRFHIVPKKFSYKQLVSLPDRASLRTMLADQDLKVSRCKNCTRGLRVNGVKIIAPEIFSSNKFMIHGIARAFKIAELPNTSR